MQNQEIKYELFKFKDEELCLDVRVSIERNTVWLNREQISLLFERDVKSIGKHINNVLKDNVLDESVVAHFATTAADGKIYNVEYYNLEMISCVGFRVKSKKVYIFQKWAKELIDYNKKSNTQKSQISQLIKFSYNDIILDVTVSPEEDTVWLDVVQLCALFDTTRQNIEYHINNIYSQNELEIEATCKEILQVQIEGNRTVNRYVDIYNLDMIISLGYKINSKNGIIFRRWATKLLKEYLLQGSAINEQRCLDCASNILTLQNKVNSLESKLNDVETTVFSSNNVLFFEGQIIEPYKFFRHLFFLAKEELTIVDYYADEFLLSILSDIKVPIIIVTSNSSYLNKVFLPKNVSIIRNDNLHGRYIFIDKHSYAIDNSFNSIGKKPFIAMRLEDGIKDKILN